MSPAVPTPRPRNGAAIAAQLAKSKFAVPRLRLEIRDLKHAGAKKFLDAVNAAECMATAVHELLILLYRSPDDATTTVPPTRSITLILRDMPGVAYTTGSELDNDHKEVHFSLSYINGIKADRVAHEIAGVISHEFVHAYQWNALGSCPGGLIEGIADWVRLNLDLGPPHWSQETDGDWDGGYQKTAYFLQYLETRFGEGSVRRINEKLRLQRYEEATFWIELFGDKVHHLWKEYGASVKERS